MNEMVFHIYKKNVESTEVIKHSVTTEELEQMLANKEVDWKHWEVETCYTDCSVEDASF
jgi:hypothetical protein